MIKSAVNHGTTIHAESRREVLMVYQYALHQHKKQLLREESETKRSGESASTTNRIQREERNNASWSSEGGHRETGHNRREAERPNRENRTHNLDSSFLSVHEIGNIMPKTPEAALVAAQTYLLTTQPAPGDPRESMHQATIKGLGLIGDKLRQKSSM
jgi:hypothetical protein